MSSSDLLNRIVIFMLLLIGVSWFLFHYTQWHNQSVYHKNFAKDVMEKVKQAKIGRQPQAVIYLDRKVATANQSSELLLDQSTHEQEEAKTTQQPKHVLHAVTYASHGGRDDRFCRAVESAIRHDYDLVILGWGVTWRGLSQKLEAAHQYAASVPPDDLLLFTDAFDVLFTDTPDTVVEKFVKGNYEILFSAECGCWPHIIENGKICFDGYPSSPTPYRYLNSGTWIGKAGLAKDMLAEVQRLAGQNFNNANDQKLVADMFISGKSHISLDYYNQIFQAMHMTLDPPLPKCNPYEDLMLTPTKHYKNKRTNSLPAIFHFNGGGKVHHLPMESKIWYKQEEYNTMEMKQKLYEHKIRVPTQPSGFMRFDEICKDYCLQSGNNNRNRRQHH